MTRILKYTVPVLIAALIACIVLSFEEHESHSLETVEFTIERPHLQVVRNLATKNSLERVAEDNNATVTGKYWDKFNVEVPQRVLRIKEYRLDAALRFTVEKRDPDLGELRLTFIQRMHLDEHGLMLDTRLVQPEGDVRDVIKTVAITPDQQNTHVTARSELTVRKTIPFFLKDHMDGKARDSNREELRKLKERIIEVSEQKGVIAFQRGAAGR